MPGNPFLELFTSNPAPETLVRQGLRLLEADLRQHALLALAGWERLAADSPLALTAVPELFSAIASLQRPSWGSWNGLLTALRKARNTILREGDTVLRGRLEQAADLNDVLARLEEPAEPALVQGLQRLGKLVRSKLSGRPRLGQVLALPIGLRNRIAHDVPSDPAWWQEAAQALRPLLGYHARPGASERSTFPAPWFAIEADRVWSFNGLEHDGAAIYVSRQGATRSDLSQSQAVLLAFQQLLGQTDVRERDFKKLLATLAPEEVKGVLLGDYLMGAPVGAGGFATVHMGRQLSTGRKVAIKVLRDGMDDEQRRRFQQEASYLAQFDHPHIVSVLGHGEDTWSPPRSFSLSGSAWFQQLAREAPIKSYIALEWIDGRTLETYIRPDSASRPSVKILAEWFAQAAEALAAVHGAGLIHRDLKPSNLMATADGRVKLMDFGIARTQADARTLHTATGQVLGTPAYMAPEQLQASEAQATIGPASDTYGLCASFYELFTGTRLFHHDTLDHLTVVTRKLAGEKPESPRRLTPDLPWEIETLLLGGLEREPKDRPASAADLAADLRRFLANQSIQYKRPPVRRRVQLWYRRHRTTVRVVTPLLSVLATVALVFGYSWYGAREAAHELEGKVGSLTGDVEVAGKAKDIATQEAKVSGEKARISDFLKVRQEYVADMRLLPELWKNSRLDLMRDRLKRYEEGKPEDLRGFEWYYWDRLAKPTGHIWQADARVSSLDWSPDGKTLYATDLTGQVVAWELATGKRRRLWDPALPAAQVVVAPKGDRLAVTTRRSQAYTVATIDAESGKQLAVTAAGPWSYEAAGFSPDGKRLVTGTILGRLPVWNAANGEFQIDLAVNDRSRRRVNIDPERVLDLHNGPIHGLAFHPSDNMVASAGADHDVGLWLLTGQFAGWLRGHRGEVASVAFSRDGLKLLSRALPTARGEDRDRGAVPGEIILWDVTTNSPIRKIEIADETVSKRAQLPDGHSIWAGNFRADWVLGERFVAVGVGTVVKIFDVGGGATPKDLKGHIAPIVSLRAAPGGNLLATADERGEVRVWNLAKQTAEEAIVKLGGPVRGLALPRDGVRFAILYDYASADSTGNEKPSDQKFVSLYDRPGAAPLTPDRPKGYYHGIAYSPSGKYVAAFDPLRANVVVWDAVTGKVTKAHDLGKTQPKSSKPGSNPSLVDLQCIAFSSDEELYFVRRSGLWRLRLDTETCAEIGNVPVGSAPTPDDGQLQVPGNAVMAMAFSPEGVWAALGTGNGDVTIYDPRTWKMVKRLNRRHRRGVTSLAFSADQRRLASCSGRYFLGQMMEGKENPGEIMIWDTATWEDCLTLECTKEGEFAGVSFAAQGRALYAASNPRPPSALKMPRGEIVRWDAGNAPAAGVVSTPVSTLAGKVYRAGFFMAAGGLTTGFQSVAVQPVGRLVAALTVHGKIILWDAQTQEMLREVPVYLGDYGSQSAHLRFSADGLRLICADPTNPQTSVHAVYAVPNLTEIEKTAWKDDDFLPVDREIREALPNQYFDHAFSRDRAKVAVMTGPRRGDKNDTAPHQIHVFLVKDRTKLFTVKLDGEALRAASGNQPVWGLTAGFGSQPLWGFSRHGQSLFAFIAPAGEDAYKAKAFSFQKWAIPSGEKQTGVGGFSFPRGIAPDLSCTLELVDGLEIYARDLASGKVSPRPVALERSLRGAVFFSDGEHFATYGLQNEIRVWNRKTLLPADPGLLFHADKVASLVISPDGKKVAYADDRPPPPPKALSEVVVFDLEKRAAVRAAGFVGHHSKRLSFAPDSRRLVAHGPGYSTILGMDPATGKVLTPTPLPTDVALPGAKPAWNGSVQLLATQPVADDHILYLIDYYIYPGESGKQPRTGKPPPRGILWDGKQARELPGLDRAIHSAAFSPQGRYVAVAIKERACDVAIYAVSDLTVVARARWEGTYVRSMEFSADEKHLNLVTASGTNGVSFTALAFDAGSGQELWKAPGLERGAIAISPDGLLLARSTNDGKIVVERTADRKEVARFGGGAARALTFFPDGRALLAAGEDSRVRRWELPGLPIPRASGK